MKVLQQKKLTDLFPLCEQLRFDIISIKRRINYFKLHPDCKEITDDCIDEKCGKTIIVSENKDKIIEELKNNILLLRKHKEFQAYQKNHYDETVKNLKENQVILIIDFKENILLNKTDRQISTDYCFRNTVTLLGIVLLKLDQNKKLVKKYYSLISEEISKSNFLVQSALNKFFIDESSEFNGCQNLQIFCDNGPHFRAQEFLHYLKGKSEKFIKVELNYFCEYHGIFFIFYLKFYLNFTLKENLYVIFIFPLLEEQLIILQELVKKFLIKKV